MTGKTALLVIDVQTGMFGGNDAVYKGEELIDTINDLIAKARRSNAPIYFIQHNGEGDEDPLCPHTDGWRIHPKIRISPEDNFIQKNHPDSFHETTLQGDLEARGITRLIITGLQTEYCIDTTCRRAYSLGYAVILIRHGHSTYDTEHLGAKQIIAHHNEVLGNWFVVLKNAREAVFAEEK